MRQEHRCGERLDDRPNAVAREHHGAARKAVGNDTADEREADASGRQRGKGHRRAPTASG
jgi:hypothetical protein